MKMLLLIFIFKQYAIEVVVPTSEIAAFTSRCEGSAFSQAANMTSRNHRAYDFNSLVFQYRESHHQYESINRL